MNRSEPNGIDRKLCDRLATSGLRSTPQRQHVYTVLLEQLDHPTAEEVFMRAKQTMPDISIATIYNCLDALVKCGLVRQVNLDRAASRYCPNMRQHHHFYCEECAGVFDIESPKDGTKPRVPEGFEVHQFEIAYRGLCPQCGRRRPVRERG